jgi:olfactory receptor
VLLNLAWVSSLPDCTNSKFRMGTKTFVYNIFLIAAASSGTYFMTFSHHLFQQIHQNMEPRYQTALTKFLLLGLTDDPELQPLIFSVFLSMYLVPVLGSLLIFLAVSSDSHLHTAMYFFLSKLSFNDICLRTSTKEKKNNEKNKKKKKRTSTIPKMLVNSQAWDLSITNIGCLNQVCFVMYFLV